MSQNQQSLSTEEVARIARLARLAPSPEKLTLYAGQLGDILGHMEILAEVDVTGVEPLYSPVEHETVFREDTAERRATREQILSNAPQDDGAFYIVPKIV
ncbi:Asp-tRNA(Asn)/Glu-tRNA(Gln) amidotransferase subunit GatC [Oceanidesulfovibrio marinus]|uniref:Aspartyl/glutamyl-tRNA(Asn/Gln) amidotransferase subunit C n=1 Tax=Oceanidesulfovibrio marinus TaxID=370038 RepID=A0A6P1ZC32_9BACT|nr:Asp-tRNA(Asn)/Glu-tRNA(Gln) amidotransferase subunit GatC [Oceanidesulfovibrio marinus]QJT10888.1 Asp-tRNA(Asn)/Glu-tRNA(Gln) amidotransferase subunit GatC [Oceanidesulfovibrio marinus]TVM30511.1 Asp-tRNA(Asn)/Glu-tRNA(Gln) amidotransferase GatCAB subunit C [Oceanidesulfovibrio marinus]